jgi:flagellar hook-associated protein 1 FlgK
MSLDLALQSARTGLAAVQRGIAQASQNIANAETPGYTRKAVPRQAVLAGDQPAGVRTGEAQRSVDAALVARLDESRSAEAAAGLRERLLLGVERTQGAPGEGGSLPDALAALRGGLVALRASPADPGMQRAALEAAEGLARGLNALGGAIGQARQQAQDAIETEVAAVNAGLREIAQLTGRLKSGLEGPAAAEIEDRRDAAVARLSESLELRAVRQPGGDILLLARGVAVLPLDPDRDLLSVGGADVSPQAYYGGGGTLPGVTMLGLDVTGRIAGGRLGEAIALRDSLLPRMQAEADLAAAHLAARFDAQGLRLFTDTGGGVPAVAGPYPGSAQVGFSARIGVNPAVAGNPALLRDGTHAVAATPGGPTAFAPNPPGGPAGFAALLDRVLTFSLGTEAAAGAPWPAIPVSGLGPDGGLASPFLGTPGIEGYVARLTSAQAADRAAATAAKEEAGALRGTLEERFARQSGVDVDAEMAGLVALQNAYAANARVLSTVQAMWDQLLGAVR